MSPSIHRDLYDSLKLTHLDMKRKAEIREKNLLAELKDLRFRNNDLQDRLTAMKARFEDLAYKGYKKSSKN